MRWALACAPALPHGNPQGAFRVASPPRRGVVEYCPHHLSTSHVACWAGLRGTNPFDSPTCPLPRETLARWDPERVGLPAIHHTLSVTLACGRTGTGHVRSRPTPLQPPATEVWALGWCCSGVTTTHQATPGPHLVILLLAPPHYMPMAPIARGTLILIRPEISGGRSHSAPYNTYRGCALNNPSRPPCTLVLLAGYL